MAPNSVRVKGCAGATLGAIKPSESTFKDRRGGSSSALWSTAVSEGEKAMNLQTCLSEQEKNKIEADIQAAEKRTSGEIVALIVDSSSHYLQIDYFGGLVFALVGFLLCVGILANPSPYLILLSEGTGFTAGFLLFRVHVMKRLWLTDRYMQHRVNRRALRAFYEHRLHETKGQNGVLIMVSLLERQTRILADRGIYAKVNPRVWEDTAQGLASALKNRHLADGLSQAIQGCGSILAEYYPFRPSDQNDSSEQVILERD